MEAQWVADAVLQRILLSGHPLCGEVDAGGIRVRVAMEDGPFTGAVVRVLVHGPDGNGYAAACR